MRTPRGYRPPGPAIVLAAAGLAAACAGLIAPVRGQSIATVWDGVFTTEQAVRGRAVYKDRCLGCHGEKLDGGVAPGLTGEDFVSDWSGRTVGDLFERTRLTMPADDPGTLKPRDVADVLAYVLSANTFPAGMTELAADRDLLKQIRIQSKK